MFKYLLLALLLTAPAIAAEPNSQAVLAGSLAQNLSQAVGENDTLRVHIKELEAKLEAATKAPSAAPAEH